MKKRILAAVLGTVMLFGLGGCGSNADAVWYGTVTNSTGIDNTVLSSISSGMETYGQSAEHQTKLYTATDDTQEAIEAQFEAAAEEDDVKVILASGSDMEIPVYNAQNAHHGTKFVLFNGQPRKDADSDPEIRKNTTVIEFSRYDLGYMAGYAAVYEGYRNLGYLTGTETDESRQSADGFADGCEAAAEALQLSEGAVVINQEYAGSDELMPLRMTEAMSWYNSGTEIIATDSETLLPAVVKAADALDKPVIASGFLYSGTSEHVLYSSTADYSGAVQAVLEASGKNKTFHGGEVQNFGFTEHAVGISADFSKFANFTESVYNTFLENAANLSESEADSTADAGTKLVTVNVQQPVTPDANAGLTASSTAGEAAGTTESEAESVPADLDEE